MRILLVEDIAALRRMVRRILGRHGHTVEDTAGPKEAMATFEQGEFDAAILDVDLGPGPNGIETAQSLRQKAPHLRIIIMSGEAAHADAVREAGFGPLLNKPFDESQLFALLRA